MESQVTDREKMFAKPVFDNRLVLKTFKDSYLNCGKNRPVQNGEKIE